LQQITNVIFDETRHIVSYGWADNAIVNIRWCGGIYYYNVVCGERILKIGYILTKLSLEVGGPLFGTQCMGSNWL